MHPILFHIGPFTIRSYGVMLAIAFLVGITVADRRAATRKLSRNVVVDLSVYILIAAIVGARLFYIIFHIDQFRDNPLEAINIVKGIAGLTMYGGLIFSIIVSIWFARKRNIPVWRMGDVFAPSLALGLGITRIGCFLNGCCHGKPTDLPWGCVFPPDSVAGSYFNGIPIQPTQLYSSLFGFIMFFVLLRLDRKRRFDGFLFWLFILIYSLFRFTIEFIRYYEPEMVFFELGLRFTWNQVISLILLVISAVMLYYLGSKPRSNSGAIRGTKG